MVLYHLWKEYGSIQAHFKIEEINTIISDWFFMIYFLWIQQIRNWRQKDESVKSKKELQQLKSRRRRRSVRLDWLILINIYTCVNEYEISTFWCLECGKKRREFKTLWSFGFCKADCCEWLGNWTGWFAYIRPHLSCICWNCIARCVCKLWKRNIRTELIRSGLGSGQVLREIKNY